MRGLKRAIMETETTGSASHLLQMRGLKRCVISRVASTAVASFTDAWIETQEEWGALDPFTSHLLQMRGLKQDNADKH